MRVIMNTYGDECGSCCGSSGSSALGATARFQSRFIESPRLQRRKRVEGGGWRVEGERRGAQGGKWMAEVNGAKASA